MRKLPLNVSWWTSTKERLAPTMEATAGRAEPADDPPIGSRRPRLVMIDRRGARSRGYQSCSDQPSRYIRMDRSSRGTSVNSTLVDRARGVTLGYQAAAMVASVALALVYVRPIEIGAAIAGTALLVGSRLLGPWRRSTFERTSMMALAAAALLVGAGLAMWWADPAVGMTETAALGLPLAAGVAFLAWRTGTDRRIHRSVALALLIALVGLIGVMWITIREAPDIDVLNLHVAAAAALLDGENPYVEARVPDTSPIAPEGAEFIGYTYPPSALVAYAGSDILFGDPRWATVIIIAVTAVLIIRPWAPMNRAQGAAAIALALAMVVQPALGWFVLHGWTDALALPFLLGCGLLWRRNPALAAVLLGLAFGTKQYFILAIPLLLAWNDDYRWRRFWIATGVAALSVLPALIVDAVAYWEATVVPGLGDPTVRLDSAGLAGLGLTAPLVVVVSLSLVIAVWMGRAGGTQTRFLLAVAAMLSAALLIGFQAFINYWFFIGNLALLAVAAALAGPVGVEGDREASEVVASPEDSVRAQLHELSAD